MENLNAFDAILKNSNGQELLHLKNNHVLNTRGQTLGTFEDLTLFNLNDQAIGQVANGDILNFQGQVLGKVEQDQLVNLNGQPIMTLEGKSEADKAKIGLAFFYFLQ